MLALDGPLDPGDEDEAAVGGIGLKRANIELAVVQRNGQGVVAKGRRAVDQVARGVWNPVNRVVRRMGMEVYLQHRSTGLFTNVAGFRRENFSIGPASLAIRGRGKSITNVAFDRRPGVRALDQIARLNPCIGSWVGANNPQKSSAVAMLRSRPKCSQTDAR